jgi:hypothetical protein
MRAKVMKVPVSGREHVSAGVPRRLELHDQAQQTYNGVIKLILIGA